jgi:23S rRNA (guanosine2251-2'-O)-methyltransferase
MVSSRKKLYLTHKVKRNFEHSGSQVSEREIIWGIHPLLAALQDSADRIHEITVLKGKTSPKIQQIIDQARQKGITVKFRSEFRLPGSGQNHQGVYARIMAVSTLSLDQLLSRIKAKRDPVLLVLDSIQDPHNLGAISRSASAAGVAGLIVNKDRSAPLGGTAAKISAGALAGLDICQVTNLATTLQRLKKEGFWIFGAAADGEQSLYQIDFSGSVCLVMGGEAKGIRPLVREQCDSLISIPMHGTLDSLNVSVAAGIILFEIVRQRLG